MEKVLFALTFLALFTSFAFESCIDETQTEGLDQAA